MKQFIFLLAVSVILGMGCQENEMREKGVEELNTSAWRESVRSAIKDDGTLDSTKIPIFQWETNQYDFGTIKEGEIVEYTFKFKNVGGKPLTLTAKTTCGCTVPKFPKDPVLPGKTGEIKVKFNSDKQVGKKIKDIKIIANTMPQITKITLTGTVTPKD